MRATPRSTALLAALAGLLVAVPLMAPTTASAAAPAPATFNTNLLLQGSDGAGDPSIRTDRFGQSFVISPTGVPACCKLFRERHDGSASDVLGFPDSTLGSGACDLSSGSPATSPQ